MQPCIKIIKHQIGENRWSYCHPPTIIYSWSFAVTKFPVPSSWFEYQEPEFVCTCEWLCLYHFVLFLNSSLSSSLGSTISLVLTSTSLHLFWGSELSSAGCSAEDCWSSSALNQAFEAQGRSEGMVEEEISYHWPPNSCDRDSGRRKRESCAEDLRLLLPDQNRMNIVTHWFNWITWGWVGLGSQIFLEMTYQWMIYHIQKDSWTLDA